MKAMILAAGFGTRLGQLTKSTPKILIDINGKSLLEIILRKLQSHGFNDIIINVHHFADMVEEEIARLSEKMEIRISVSDERDELLDTGGGLYRAKDFFDDKPFLLYNGDILTDLDLAKLYEYHIRKNASATIATRNREGNRFFLVDNQGQVRGWTNRQSKIDIVTIDEPAELNEIASMAITVLNPSVFEIMQAGNYTMTSILLELAVKELVTTYMHNRGHWIDVGSPSKLEEARNLYQ